LFKLIVVNADSIAAEDSIIYTMNSQDYEEELELSFKQHVKSPSRAQPRPIGSSVGNPPRAQSTCSHWKQQRAMTS
jgi:hypothetical protein